MEIWFIIIIVCVSVLTLFKLLFVSVFSKSITSRLPPGPTNVPIITSFLFLRKSFSDIEPILRNLCLKFGPVITLRIGSRPVIFIRDRHLAYSTLVQNGAVFASRPPAFATNRIFNADQHNVSSAPYGPTWRLLRRNLASEILHPSRVGSYSRARKWVLEILLGRLQLTARTGEPVRVIDDFQYAMFCLLVLMCFGDKLDEKKIREIETIQHRLLITFDGFNFLNFWPKLSKIIFRKWWAQLHELRRNLDNVFLPLIRARKSIKSPDGAASGGGSGGGDEFVLSYIDTLLDLHLPEENRNLTETEIVSLCSEFLNAGTDTTSTALQWIMANLVKNPNIQNKLFAEIDGLMEDSKAEEVREEDLQKLPYLKAVVLEGLRRHPPAHFVLPHAVTEDAAVGGYVVPKTGTVNFMVAEMGWDPEVWEEPMEFRPERFMTGDGKGVEAFDVTGSKEIKMMPFGVGRRICPAHGLAMLHLEYFVANLVWRFEWSAVAGDDVDLSEKQEFTIVMKTPLKAQISVRSK